MSDDEEIFERAMEQLGTKRDRKREVRPKKDGPRGVTVTEELDFDAIMREGHAPARELRDEAPGRGGEVGRSPARAPIEAPSPPSPVERKRYAPSPEEAQAFLDAMSRIDAIPPERAEEPASETSRRRDEVSDLARRLKRGEVESEAVLDLHGLTVKQARPRVAAFVDEAQREGWQVVTVVVGRGRHSDRGEAVLRPAVERWLGDDHRDAVLEVLAAPPHMGGSGAWVAAIRIAPRG